MKTVIEMARSVGATAYTNRHYPERPTHTFSVDQLERFAELVRLDEREQIAQMIEGAPPLVEFAQNDQGGCVICGFTPRLAAKAIRARGNT